jgi:pyridoxal biosynthesis lyase PdxS
MSHFIFMLTQADQTISHAHAVYEEIRHSPLRYIGFKDIGLPLTELVALAQAIRRDHKKVMLEVVSTSREQEIKSIEAALHMGVDYLLGGRHVHDAVSILKGTTVQYFPFAGHTVGHPTKLTGSMDEIVADAQKLAELPGVHGLDLLAYRFAGDAPELTRRVVQAVKIPVIAAGSINTPARIQAMRLAGAWGFTVGSAIFESEFLSSTVSVQVDRILKFNGVSA